MLNKVILIGRLTSNVELRHTNEQVPYAYFTLAVNRGGSASNRDKTDFISCVAFRSTAEVMARYLSKGSLISVEGRLEVYRSENAGEYQTRTNVVVNNLVFLESKRSQNESAGTNNMTFANNQNIIDDAFNGAPEMTASESAPTMNETQDNNKKETNEEFDFENFEIKI